MRRIGIAVLCAMGAGALIAPLVATAAPEAQFVDRAYAPPMRVHLRDADGWHRPFVYAQRLDNRSRRQFSDDRSQRVTLSWLAGGRLISIDPSHGPLLLLGADALGRDIWSRLVYGARLSLGVTLTGAAGALLLGVIIGGLAGALGGRVETALMLLTDFVLVLPAVYLVLVLRAALPLVLSTSVIFALMALLFVVAGWPHVARGVRAIVSAERSRDYAEAARAAGAGPLRLARHLVPAASGFLATETILLIPALLAAEATISYLGLGFPEADASWGTMLREASNAGVVALAPWMLAPAAALFLVVLAVQLTAGERAEGALFTGRG